MYRGLYIYTLFAYEQMLLSIGIIWSERVVRKWDKPLFIGAVK